MAKQRRRAANVAALQGLTRCGRRDGFQRTFLIGDDLFDNFDLDTEFRRGIAQKRGRAGSSRAEMEIIAYHHRTRAEAAQKNVLQKPFRVEAGQSRVESEDKHAIKAEFRHPMGFGFTTGEPEDAAAAPEKIDGMGLEGQNGARTSEAVRQGDCSGDDNAMTSMHAVEIADGDDSAR